MGFTVVFWRCWVYWDVFISGGRCAFITTLLPLETLRFIPVGSGTKLHQNCSETVLQPPPSRPKIALEPIGIWRFFNWIIRMESLSDCSGTALKPLGFLSFNLEIILKSCSWFETAVKLLSSCSEWTELNSGVNSHKWTRSNIIKHKLLCDSCSETAPELLWNCFRTARKRLRLNWF